MHMGTNEHKAHMPPTKKKTAHRFPAAAWIPRAVTCRGGARGNVDPWAGPKYCSPALPSAPRSGAVDPLAGPGTQSKGGGGACSPVLCKRKKTGRHQQTAVRQETIMIKANNVY